MRWFFLSIIAAMAFADLAWWLFADRKLRPLPRSAAWRIALAAFMAGQFGLLAWIVLGRVAGADTVATTPGLLMTAAYVWHLLVLPVCVAIMAVSVVARCAGAAVGGFGRLAGTPRSRAAAPVAAASGPPAPGSSRRQFLGAMVAVAPPIVAGAGIGAALLQSGQLRVRRIEVGIPGLSPALDGLRIAHVADLHVGRFTEGATLRRIVEATSRLDADLILLPGDLINNSLADLSDAIDAVRNMQSRHGAYLCLGNHDLIDNGAEFVARTKSALPLLVDESATLRVRGQEIQLLGLPWLRDEERMASAVASLAGQVREGALPILLAHHPHAFDAAAAAGIPLTLSGHTHGGQLMLPMGLGFGPLLYRYWSGLYRKSEQGGAALVVSNGAGNWLPLRTNAPAEIIEIVLRRPDVA